MKKKHITTLLLLALTGCGSDTSNPDTSNPDTVAAQETNAALASDDFCMNLDGSEICLPASIQANSGDRIYIPLTGNISNNVTLTWSSQGSDSLDSPVILSDGSGAYVVAPITEVNGSIDLLVEGNDGTAVEEIHTVLNVFGTSNLIVNGINSAIVDESGNLVVEWMPAVTKSSAIANNVTYNLNVTRMENGALTSESRDFVGSGLSQTVDVGVGETYRLVLSVTDENLISTYTEHLDFTVPAVLPELAPVTIDSAPVASSYSEGQLINQSGDLKIVRINESGTKYLADAEGFEAYSESAPLVVTLRVKDLTDEEIAALSSNGAASQARSMAASSGVSNTFKITLPSGYVPTESGSLSQLMVRAASQSDDAEDDDEEESGSGSVGVGLGTTKACLNYERTGIKVDACAPYKKIRVVCEAKYELSKKPKVEATCYFSGSIEVEAEASLASVEFEFMWPLPEIEKDIKGTPLVVAPNLGLKGEFQAPISLKSEFEVKASLVAGGRYWVGDYYIPHAAPFGKASPGIDSEEGKMFQVTLPNPNEGIQLGLETKLGAFPEVKIGEYLTANFEAAGQLSADVTYITLAGVSTNGAPVVSYVDANIKAKAYTKIEIASQGLYYDWLTFTDEWETTSPEWAIYDHPDNIGFTASWSNQCVGNATYTDTETPVTDVPEYGTLSAGQSYGYGHLLGMDYTFNTGTDLKLVSAGSLGSNVQVNIFDSSVIMDYTEMPATSQMMETIVMKFRSPKKLGVLFPFYGVEKVETRWQDANAGIAPWVCWGSSYTPEEDSFSGSFTLLEAAKMWEVTSD